MRRYCVASGAGTVLVTGAVLLAAGCAATAPRGGADEPFDAYRRHDYAQAYRTGAAMASSGNAAQRDAGAFVAGLSAQKLGDHHNAERYLRRASASTDRGLAADALAQLGLVHAELSQYDLSAGALLEAAVILSGQDRANAYFYGAVAQQKLGRWSQARNNLYLARYASHDPDFHRRVSDQLGITGYTVQIGAYHVQDNAQRKAQQVAQRAIGQRLGAPRLVTGRDRYGRPLTYVQVGEFARFQSARQARKLLGDYSAIIVPLEGR